MVYYTCEGWLSTDASCAWLTVNLLVKELVDWLLFVEKLTLFFVASIFTHGKIHGKSGHVFQAYCLRFYPDPFWRICRGALGWQLPNELGEYPSHLGAGLSISFNCFLSIQKHGQIRAKNCIIASICIHLYHASVFLWKSSYSSIVYPAVPLNHWKHCSFPLLSHYWTCGMLLYLNFYLDIQSHLRLQAYFLSMFCHFCWFGTPKKSPFPSRSQRPGGIPGSLEASLSTSLRNDYCKSWMIVMQMPPPLWILGGFFENKKSWKFSGIIATPWK